MEISRAKYGRQGMEISRAKYGRQGMEISRAKYGRQGIEISRAKYGRHVFRTQFLNAIPKGNRKLTHTVKTNGSAYPPKGCSRTHVAIKKLQN
jgi:hypothetical protein